LTAYPVDVHVESQGKDSGTVGVSRLLHKFTSITLSHCIP